MKNYYDILHVDKNSSEKEIKDSFIKLSKKYHPDKNKDADAHKKFVEVNEAYSVLGKPASRKSYDATLSSEMPQSTVNKSTHYNTRPLTKTPYEYYRDQYYANYVRAHQDGSQAYFTRSKVAAVFLCFFLVAIGSGIQTMALYRRRKLQSHEIAIKFKEQRQRSHERLEKLKKQQQAVNENETTKTKPREF